MSFIEIRTFFKINDAFVPIETFTEELPDTDYVDGAISCTIDGKQLFTLREWDLVDQLWCYIIEGLENAVVRGSWEACFPDQPLKLRFESTSGSRMSISVGDKIITGDLQLIAQAMGKAAIEFFEKMRALNPAHNEAWDQYSAKASRLLTQVAK